MAEDANNQAVIQTPTKKPPRLPVRSKQFDLFSDFLGDAADLSNTIELWDAIPKYAVTARRQSAMRGDKGRLPVHEYEFEHRDTRCRLEVQPAAVKIDGKFQDFYPSADEELVEEVLRKIFADQRYGLHVPAESESWVKFSINMIRKELKAKGKTRSDAEIIRSLEILNKTVVTIYVERGDEEIVYGGAVLSDMARVNRKAYLADSDALWIARLPVLVSRSINEVTYRQFNYGVLMSLTTQLARWLHKRLCHAYVNAGYLHDYSPLFSTVQADSGLLTANTITKNVKAMEAALDELADHKVLMGWEKEERRGPRNKLEDIKYHMKAHPDFIAETKAANARQRDGRKALTSR